MLDRVLGGLRFWTRFVETLLGLSVFGRLAYLALCESAASRADDALAPGDLARIRDLAGSIGALSVAGVIGFAIWARMALAAGQMIAPAGTKRVSPSGGLLWLVPFLNLYLPFILLRDLIRATDPTDLAPIEGRVRPPRGYRLPGVEMMDAWKPPKIPLRSLWALWAIWQLGYVAAVVFPGGVTLAPTALHFEAARAVVGVGAATAFILVARGTGKLVAERARRLAALKQA
jgi:Domain of unknown function (DUF4328)